MNKIPVFLRVVLFFGSCWMFVGLIDGLEESPGLLGLTIVFGAATAVTAALVIDSIVKTLRKPLS